MTNFESKHFQKLAFQKQQVNQFLLSAQHDLKIAHESKVRMLFLNLVMMRC